MEPINSPLWCNTSPTLGNVSPTYDGYHFYYWYPRRNYTVWFDTPIMEATLADGNVCYQLKGNVWFCPTIPVEELPPEVSPLPTVSTTGNVRPTITLTSVKMENHPEHITVMFSQALNNLK